MGLTTFGNGAKNEGYEATGYNDRKPRHVTSCQGSQGLNALFIKTLRSLLPRRLNHRSCLNTVVKRKQRDEHRKFQNNAPTKTLEPARENWTNMTLTEGWYSWAINMGVVTQRNLALMGSHRLQGLLVWKQKAAECEFVQKWLDTSK
jgi:hypothetical protein